MADRPVLAPYAAGDHPVSADFLAPATFFEDSVHDDLMEICIRLAGELWVTRERLRALEDHLVATEVIEPHAVDGLPVVEQSQTVAHRKGRQTFVEGVFGGIVNARP